VAGTIIGYERGAGVFLEDRVAQVGGLELERLTAGDVSGFLARECPRRSVNAARDLAARLRQLLRYLHVVGVIDTPLEWAVPPVADLRGRSLPKAVAPAVIAALLASCDLELVIGRRDFAVLLLLSRLGLRAGEVAAIRLDDVDWRAGDLLVHGKGHREDTMPLPVDVGEALVEYLQVRPASEHRALFLCALAPFGAVSSHVVAMIVRRACRRARIPEVGPHSLRHTAATEMLRASVSLEEIAQVLRHRQLQSTAIYARVDVDSLRALALPWPGGRP
jgi:integrase/recombinase XerD